MRAQAAAAPRSGPGKRPGRTRCRRPPVDAGLGLAPAPAMARALPPVRWETVSSYQRRLAGASHLDRRAPGGPDQCRVPGRHRVARGHRRAHRARCGRRRHHGDCGVTRPRRGYRRAVARPPAGRPRRWLAAAGRHRAARPQPRPRLPPGCPSAARPRHPDGRRGPAGSQPGTATCGCVRRRVLALRSVGRLPEAERRALVIDALGEQPVRLALGLVRAAAGRPDPAERSRDVVDAVGQLDPGLGARR
jgi:hypothetical protein